MTVSSNFIKRFGFKIYKGEFKSRFYRIMNLCWFNMRERIFNQWSVAIPLLLLVLISLFFILPFSLALSSAIQFLTPDQRKILTFNDLFVLVVVFLYISPLTTILFGFIGGRIVAEDLEYKSLEQYFIRIRRSDYLLGKFLSIFLSYLGILTLITAIFYWWFNNTLGVFVLDPNSLITLSRMFIYLIITTLAESLVMVAISSSTEKKNYATLIYIILFIALTGITRIFAVLLDNNFFLLFNPDQILLTIYFGINQFSPNLSQASNLLSIISQTNIRHTQISFEEGIGVLFVYMTISILFIYRRISTIWK